MVETKDLEGYRVGTHPRQDGPEVAGHFGAVFENVRVPAANLLGGAEGQGFYQLMGDLALRACLDRGGRASPPWKARLPKPSNMSKSARHSARASPNFKTPSSNWRKIATKTRIARVFVDDCIAKIVNGSLDTVTASMAKYWITDMQQEVLDECVQLHGGYGYMNEYLVCRMFADARVQRIYGGTNEIMKELISRSL